MEPTTTLTTSAPTPLICPYCHQPVLSTYYFCPNCGTKLDVAPLSTSPATQAWIYAFAIILPFLLYIPITKWPAWKYYKSEDPKAKQIGMIALALIVLSTVVIIYVSIVGTQALIQSQLQAINADMSATGM